MGSTKVISFKGYCKGSDIEAFLLRRGFGGYHSIAFRV